VTHEELFDAAVPALRREAQRLESSGLRWGQVVSIVSEHRGEPLVLMQRSDAAIAMLARHSDDRHAALFDELDRLGEEFPELGRVVLNGTNGWHVGTLEWSTLQ
jgi:hypothetical protein